MTAPGAVAVTGMAGRFPGAGSGWESAATRPGAAGGPDALWRTLTAGAEAVRRFTPAELRAAGVPRGEYERPDYVPCAAELPGVEDFDAALFGITPAEARLTDPQHRIFLESVLAALEDAGTPPGTPGNRIGVFGATSLSSYLLGHLLPHPAWRDRAFTHPVLLGNDKDFLATRACHALDLRGPGVTVQSACSGSLVAVDQARAALLSGACDVAVAGGVSVRTPQATGHRWLPGGPFSRDGHCRPFSADATGMVRGSGCGAVVLKRLADALADGDPVHAVIAATAVNNDGRDKAGFTAPSAAGQERVVRACLEAAGLPASAVGYAETHGTGTPLGDPIELAALDRALRAGGDPPEHCWIGSLKANIGHLDAAAGIAGLIKAVLVLRHGMIPPQINAERLNPELRLDDTPFAVSRELLRPQRPVRAVTVTALGIGGTNAHAVLTPAPAPAPRPPQPGGPYTLTLGAPDPERLRAQAGDLLEHLERHPGTRLDDLARTLAHGRRPQPHRATLTVTAADRARDALLALREGRDHPAHHPPGAGPGDLRHARLLRLPGTRLRPVRHWIDPPPPAAAGEPPAPEPAPDGHHDPVTAATEVLRSVLGLPGAGPDDDFFTLGGDSLQAVDAVETLNRRLGSRLTPEEFTSLRTPRRLAARASGTGAPAADGLPAADVAAGPGRQADPPAGGAPVLVREGDPGLPPVVLLHPSGGTTAFARELARHIRDRAAVHAIGYPAHLAGRLDTVPRIARHHAGLVRRLRPAGPYRIGGYSFGGLVALETARLLTAGGEDVDLVLLFDTPAPRPAAPAAAGDLRLLPAVLRLALRLPEPDGPSDSDVPDLDAAVEAVRQPGWGPQAVRQVRELATVWRVCERAADGFDPEPYPGRVHLFTAREPLPDSPPARAAGATGTVGADDWSRWLTGPLEVTAVPGDHFGMFDPGNVEVLAAAYDDAVALPAPAPGTAAPAAPAPETPATPLPHPAAGPSRPASRPAPREAVAAPAGPVPPEPVTAGRQPVALLFPGQGTQYPGMGAGLLARHPAAVREADEVLGWSVAAVCAGDPRRPLDDTAHSQPALHLLAVLALREYLDEAGEPPAVALGHSVGEYAALHAAGVFDAARGLALVADRGRAMSGITGGMLAVGGLTEDDLLGLLDDPGAAVPDGVALAAVNGPHACVLGGPADALDALVPLLLERGARTARRLNVSGPFHTPLMRPAADAFRRRLERPGTPWSPPAFPVIANTTARPHTPRDLRAELAAQIDTPVRWSRSLEYAVTAFDPVFHEIGGRRLLLPTAARVRAALTAGPPAGANRARPAPD